MYRSQTGKKLIIAIFPIVPIIFAIALIASFAPEAGAQIGRGFGSGASLSISIYDSTARLIDLPAQVVLTPEGSIAGVHQTVCDDGIAAFNSLPFGGYSVMVRVIGFADAVTQVELSSDALSEVSVFLQPDDRSTQAGAMGIVLAPKAEKQLQQGLEALQASKFGVARQHLEAAHKLAPADPDVNTALGELYMVQRNLAEAEKYIDHATSVDPDNITALIAAGRLRLLQAKPAAAQAPLEHAVNLAPRDKMAHWLLGIDYLDLGFYEKSRFEAVQIVKLSKSTATDGEFLMAQALAKLGRTDEAIETLRKFVHQLPNDVYTPDAKRLLSQLQTRPAPQMQGQSQPAGAQPVAAK